MVQYGSRWLLSRADRDDNVPLVEARDFDDVTGARGLDDLVVADIHAHVAKVDVKEHEISWLKLAWIDSRECVGL